MPAESMTSLSDEQRAARRLGLGGSDAAAACGLSKWKTPVQLWEEKTGISEEEDIGGKEFVQWGILLEDVIAREWSRRSGRDVRRSNKTHQDKEYPFMLANIDRDIVHVREGLEVKTANAFVAHEWGDDGTDEVPLYYLISGAHYMRVMNYDAWNFAVLLGGNELRSYRIERDEKIETDLIGLESAFWGCVETNTPPDPITIDDLLRLHPNATGAKKADEAIALKVAEMGRVKDQKKELKEREEQLKFDIAAYLGDASDLIDPHDDSITIATYRNRKVTKFDKKGMAEDHPSLVEEYTERDKTRAMLIK